MPFKSKLLTACAWAAPVLAAVIPHPQGRPAHADDTLLHLDVQHSYAQATFSVPCIGCLGRDHTDPNDESLILSFTSHAQDHACGSSNITLNGLHLPQEWNGDSASGSGSYLAQDAWLLRRDLDLEWKTACLHGTHETDTAQLLTLSIKAIDGKQLDTPSGFTISFKPHTSPPSLLRLESVPNPSASNKDVAESWREPPQALRLVVAENADSPAQAESLEDDVRQLKALEAELQVLQDLIAKQKKHIHSRLRKEAQSVSQELSDCDTISCIVKTIVDKAHGAWRIAYIRFQPNQKPTAMGRPEHAFAQVNDHVAQVAQLAQPPENGSRVAAAAAPQTYTAAAIHIDVFQVELPPRPTKESAFIVALEITFGILCCGCLFTAIRHKCSSLRTRTERAAAREERINARAYRRAARQHAWSTWWRNRWRGNWARRRDSERIADYEEKRALISEQESVLEDAMQEEIRQLRAAHDVVNDLVRDAEEGRNINHAPCVCQRHQSNVPCSPLSTASTYPPTSLPEIPSRPLSRTESLPSYRSGTPTEPPGYDSDQDMSEVVANGFHQYAAASTTSEVSSHWTPDSSVVDVSPRPSAETLRYPVSIYTLDEEESEAD
ncbi:hypothetical protein yc1106_02678 [Curvularia clavata]|uniref:Uncharacterized protein n=1 Tax=Curvularia clavata TaxID=95742 RepID=A0A9Q8Z3N9_CURCL|nr:hypothetical protein yc1106_02678 [Curvularia clavata]